ncbi:MAG: NAD-dependent epimerase/dehydratase family protein [Patescibacteria group bacterium]
MKILVTGSAGFIGSYVFEALEKAGHEVYGLDDLSGGYLRNVTNKRRFTKLDLRDRAKTATYIKRLQPGIIFHLAADATEGRSQFTPFSAVERNINAYINLLVPAIKYGLQRMILTSSMSVYGKQQVPFKESMIPQPEDIYGISKAAIEQQTQIMSKVFGFSYVIIRPHNVYGPRQNLGDPYRNVIGIFINRLMQGKPFYIYGDGIQERAFSYIDDVIEPMITAAFSPKADGKIFNLGSDTPVSLKELSDVVLEEFFEGKPVPTSLKPIHVPDRPQEVKYAYSDHTQAKKILKFKATIDIREGMKSMVAWAKQLGPQKFTYLDEMDLDHPDTPKTWKEQLI